MRNFKLIEKIGAVYMIKSSGGESGKYLGWSSWYFQNVGLNTKNSGIKYWFHLISIDQQLRKIQENKYMKVPFGTLQSL